MDLITKRLKFKDCNSDKANELAKRFHIKADEMEYVSKGFAELDGMEIKEGERAVIKYVSTISVDRDGEIILPDGWLLDEFEKTKLFLYGHNYGGKGQLPIGRDLWIKTNEKGLLAKQSYANHQMANDVYNMHKDGFPLPASVGFIPIKWVDKTNKKEWDKVVGQVKTKYFLDDDAFKGANRIYTKQCLLEHSDVPVACNSDALTLAVKSGDFVFQSKDVENDLFPEEPLEKITVEISDELLNMFKTLEDRIKQLEVKDAIATVDIPIEEPKGITLDKAQELIGKALDKITLKIDKKRGLV